MRVIFLQNIKGTAQMGDIKNVADGYARNFLLPRKLAQPATAEAVKQAEMLKAKRATQDLSRKENALELAKKLEAASLEFIEDTNEEGQLYGSVDAKKIAAKLREAKIILEPEQINLPHHLKSVGEYEVEIELHPEVKTKIKVVIKPNQAL